MINISEEEYEHYRYRNMLFRLYHAFSNYRDMIIENGGSDPEGWEMRWQRNKWNIVWMKCGIGQKIIISLSVF